MQDRIEQAKHGITIVASVRKRKGQYIDEVAAWAEANGLLVYIGRPGRGWPGSLWRNPFRMADSSEEERTRVIACHCAYLEQNTELLAHIPELCGKILGCWCFPKPCHGDVLASRANGI